MASYTFLENIEADVPIPETGILSRTLFNDESIKVTAFGFSAGHEMSSHSAPTAAILYFVKGEAEVTLGEDKKRARAGSMFHMAPQLPHAIVARTPLVMLLWMIKQVRMESA
jgi:quercetin dioxygenase-like cupin family protein